MINPTTPTGENNLASLASLYPQAFAMAIASGSRCGLALRLARNSGFNPCHIDVDKPASGKLANTTGNTTKHAIMKHSKLILLLFTVTMFAAGCKPSEEQSTQQQLDKARQETKTAAQNMKDYTYAQKAEFIEAMQGQLTALNHDLDELSAKIDKSSDAVKAEAKPKLQALRDQAAGLNKQLDEAKNATESTWDSVQKGFVKAYESSKDGFNQARQWVSDKIAP